MKRDMCYKHSWTERWKSSCIIRDETHHSVDVSNADIRFVRFPCYYPLAVVMVGGEVGGGSPCRHPLYVKHPAPPPPPGQPEQGGNNQVYSFQQCMVYNNYFPIRPPNFTLTGAVIIQWQWDDSQLPWNIIWSYPVNWKKNYPISMEVKAGG